MRYSLNSPKYKAILFFLALILFIIIYKILNINSLSYNKEWSHQTTDLLYEENSLEYCNPYSDELKQFYVEIDNSTYPKYVPLFYNQSINFECLNKNKRKNLILFWNKWFGTSNFDYGLGKDLPFENNKCPVTNCELTNDKKRVADSYMIIFHMRDKIDYLPSYRTPKQRWIFLLYESPIHSGNYIKYNGLFNLSATYKKNSDFSSFYLSNFIWEKHNELNTNMDFFAFKTEFGAAIVVSNCGANNKRLSYIEELGRYIPINIFGKCGKACPTHFDNGTRGNCKDIISSKFKFYLAFENSICEDYITEKFFDILRYDIIPVVYGGGDYEYHVPKSAYINVMDYETPKKLANYLMFLSKNTTAYNAYFAWKRNIKFVDYPYFGPLCELCIRLNLELYEGVKHKTIVQLDEFWSAKKDCRMVEEETLKVFTYKALADK